jgi:3-isopropylmalate/(R)-2-methylmalate dehydratase large subunit
MGKTLFDKIWDQHVVTELEDGLCVLYIDRHLIHEVTSPQAFKGLEERGLELFRPQQILATADHNVPTLHQELPIQDPLSRYQVDTLTANCDKFGVELYGLGHPSQGIVHVIGPELGATHPGMTIVCGDSHTSTHGAFGCIAFGIGTSEVEMVMATQCLLQSRPKRMRITVDGVLQKGVLAKDIILFVLSQISASGATGYFVEYAGTAIQNLSMEGRMTICNMSIEMGARGGLIAPDATTFEYLHNRVFAPNENWEEAVAYWSQWYTDEDASFDKEYHFHARDIAPMVTYGTNPGMGAPVAGNIPTKAQVPVAEHTAFDKSLQYMGLQEGQALAGQPVDYVFIGSCTNSRIEDLRTVAQFVKGKQKSPHVEVWVVPGSKAVERQAREEGIDKIFEAAGFALRQPGCSACLGMNEDKIPAGKYCVSTSNRNFEGRQGPASRTLLASPLTAAAAAITGVLTDVRELI